MIKTFKQAVNFLESLIPRGKARKHPGKIGLLRQKYLLKLLDNPQNKYPCVHITGTAGKGSTAYLISNILKTAGYKVGLHISPHLEIITERVQINNKNLGKQKFIKLVNYVKPIIEKIGEDPKYGKPTYFEALAGLTFLAFVKEKVNIAVIEVGMGGKFDGTNVIKNPLISIITNIGLDHTKILGKTVEKIAGDKKEIIKKNSIVISGVKQESVQKIVASKCLKQNSKLYLLNKDFKYKIKKIDKHGEIFDFFTKSKKYKNLNLSLLGYHQVENASLAIFAIEMLKNKGFRINEKQIRKALLNSFFAGRLEIVKNKPLLVFDGAHNEDKIKALTVSFPKLFSYEKLIVVFALKRDKNIETIFPEIAKIASKIIVTRFTIGCDIGLNLSYPPEKLANEIKNKFNFQNLLVVSSPIKAIKKALKLQRKNDVVLVTGSLYLIGELKTNKNKY